MRSLAEIDRDIKLFDREEAKRLLGIIRKLRETRQDIETVRYLISNYAEQRDYCEAKLAIAIYKFKHLPQKQVIYIEI